MAGRFDRRLTVVVAGAGYGKTTLLSQAVDENRMDPRGTDAWLLASDRDRAPAHFMAGLSASLVGDPAAAPDVDSVRDLVLLRAPESVCLIIDDAHVLDGSETWTIIAELLEQLPRNGHLVVGSRTMPALSVRRLQATGQAVVVEQDALAFTSEELDDLAGTDGFQRGGDVRLPSWPALAVLTGTAGYDASIGYLWEEILRGLPEERSLALGSVCRLDLIDDELVEAVCGIGWTASSLLSGLPLVDSLGDSYRLHDLWRAALAEVAPAEVWRDALTRGAEVLLGRGDLVRAVKAFRDAGEVDRMIEVARRFVSLPLSTGLNRAEAEVLYDLLPAAARSGPVGRCLESVLLWNADEVHQALRQMLERATAESDDEMRALAWWRLVQLHGDTDPATMTVPDELRDLADAGWPLARSAVALVRSHMAQERADVKEAIAVLDDLGGPHPQTRKVSVGSRLLALGQPEMVAVTLDDVLAEGAADPIAAQAVWFRGDIDPDLAWPIAAEMPAAYGLRRFAGVEVPLLGIVSSVALAAGANAEARSLADRAVARAHLVVPRLALFAHVADALVALIEAGEDTFRVRIGAALADVALEPWPAWAYLGALTPIRALVAGTSWLDDLDLGPALATAVAAGRAVADLRSGEGPAAAVALPWDAIEVLKVHVPAPLLCELAVAASGSSPAAARHVSQVPDGSRWVRRLLDHPDRTVRERAAGLAARMPVRPDHDLRIRTFGGLTVERSDDVDVADLARRGRLRQLLARLVVERSVLRAQLAEEMWPDLEPDQAANNLRVTLSKLLDVVEPGRPGGDAWWLRTTGDRLELVLDGLTIDADDFDRHLREARHAEANGAPSVAYDCYSSALALYGGEFLAGIDEPMAVHERVRLQSLAFGAACRQAELQLARGEPEVALDHAGTALRIDGYGERAFRLLMRCHAALGSTAAARATADLLVERLAGAGLAPEPETARALEGLRP
jgi:DNA-binding SARP family transcriptional activator